MCKKLIMVCLVLAMASIAAGTEYLVDDFESGTLDGWMDGQMRMGVLAVTDRVIQCG